VVVVLVMMSAATADRHRHKDAGLSSEYNRQGSTAIVRKRRMAHLPTA
jgi:hypothetical protein